MRPKQTNVLTRAQKRAASESFREYDPDAADSSTESESETERLERYPAKAKPSPRKRSGQMLEHLREARHRATGKHALRDEMEEEGRGLAVRTQRARVAKRDVAKLEVMPDVLDDPMEMDDDDKKPGSGQVFIDGKKSKRTWDAVMRARRAVVARSETDDGASNLPKSDVGFFASLPGELRNRIYRFALVEGDNQPFRVNMEAGTCNLGACVHMRMPTAMPGILSVCKQIRAEAMPIFIAENSFKFDDQLVKARCVANWIRVIGPYDKLLSKVILDLVCWKFPPGPHAAGTVQEKVGVHYEMALRWKTQPEGRWSLHTDHDIVHKATSEWSTLDHYIDSLNKETASGRKAKEEALRDFVWSDWLAKLVYICRK